eukprot:scaffold8696_cov90-Isochrysis_galbana.AAC.2
MKRVMVALVRQPRAARCNVTAARSTISLTASSVGIGSTRARPPPPRRAPSHSRPLGFGGGETVTTMVGGWAGAVPAPAAPHVALPEPPDRQ